MNPDQLQRMIEEAEADGYTIVQQGRVTLPEDPTDPKQTWSDRCEGFTMAMLGTTTAPTWRSRYDNRLLDDGHRWVHLRRDRRTI